MVPPLVGKDRDGREVPNHPLGLCQEAGIEVDGEILRAVQRGALGTLPTTPGVEDLVDGDDGRRGIGNVTRGEGC